MLGVQCFFLIYSFYAVQFEGAEFENILLNYILYMLQFNYYVSIRISKTIFQYIFETVRYKFGLNYNKEIKMSKIKINWMGNFI